MSENVNSFALKEADNSGFVGFLQRCHFCHLHLKLDCGCFLELFLGQDLRLEKNLFELF